MQNLEEEEPRCKIEEKDGVIIHNNKIHNNDTYKIKIKTWDVAENNISMLWKAGI